MVTKPSRNAQALYAFLQDEWDRLGTTQTAWCRENNIPDITVYRWKSGVEPDLRNLKRIAEALGRPLIDILVKAKYITEEQAGGYSVPIRSNDILEAIKLDPNISDGEREALRQVHDAFALVNTGRARKVRVRGSTGSKR